MGGSEAERGCMGRSEAERGRWGAVRLMGTAETEGGRAAEGEDGRRQRCRGGGKGGGRSGGGERGGARFRLLEGAEFSGRGGAWKVQGGRLKESRYFKEGRGGKNSTRGSRLKLLGELLCVCTGVRVRNRTCKP
eukprot:364394-Chlamydomonas_euryale.AAC.8